MPTLSPEHITILNDIFLNHSPSNLRVQSKPEAIRYSIPQLKRVADILEACGIHGPYTIQVEEIRRTIQGDDSSIQNIHTSQLEISRVTRSLMDHFS
jgi:hypothetical protein